MTPSFCRILFAQSNVPEYWPVFLSVSLVFKTFHREFTKEEKESRDSFDLCDVSEVFQGKNNKELDLFLSNDESDAALVSPPLGRWLSGLWHQQENQPKTFGVS